MINSDRVGKEVHQLTCDGESPKREICRYKWYNNGIFVGPNDHPGGEGVRNWLKDAK